MEKPIGIESRNVRASTCRNNGWCLCLSHHAVISLDLCLLPLRHLSFLLYSLQIYAKLPCFHGSLDFLQGCISLFGHIPHHPFYLFLVKTGQNWSNHHFAALKTVLYPQNHVFLPTVNTENGRNQVGTNSRLCPFFVRSMFDCCPFDVRLNNGQILNKKRGNIGQGPNMLPT